MFDQITIERAALVLDHYRARGGTIATAESCTGGLVAALLTEVPGASDVFLQGFVTYSNEAKSRALAVPEALLVEYGAVSEEVARAMAAGAVAASGASAAVAITGVAGPGGGSEAKPVGLVHVAAHARAGARLHRECRFGPEARGTIRRLSVEAALDLLFELAS